MRGSRAHLVAATLALAVLALPQAAGAVEPPPALVGTWGTSGSGDGEFDAPADVAVNPVTGFVYVLDSANHRVQRFTGDGTFVDEWGGPGVLEGDFLLPQGIAVNPITGDVYVADTGNSRIQKFDADGDHLASYGGPLPMPASLPPYPLKDNTDGFVAPWDVAVNPASGQVYVADSGNNRIMRFDANLEFEKHWGAPGGLPGTDEGEFVLPTGVAVDPGTGQVYVADNGNDRIQKFGGGGSFVTEWNGLDSPNGPSVGPGSAVFVADTGNDRIQKFTASGGFLVAWGQPGLDGPSGTAAVPTGQVFVADTGNDRIQVFGPSPATLVVDDDGYATAGDCNAPYPAFAFSRVQYAIDFARPGDRILVCPGLYPEQVRVDKLLTLTGPGPTPTSSCHRPRPADPAVHAILRGATVPGEPTVTVDANGIVWDGFVVETAAGGPGIATSPARSGYTIRRNVVQGNAGGILLESSASSTVIKNCIRQNDALGASSGYGIRSLVLLRGARIDSNVFFANSVRAVSLEASPQGVSVSSNISRADGAFVLIAGSASSRVNANIVQGVAAGGVTAAAGNAGLQIRGNIVQDGAGDGIMLAGAPTNARITVSGNIVERMSGNGILFGPDASSLGTFQGNIGQGNGGDGIKIAAGGNAGNRLSANIFQSNRPHDCHDSTGGAKPANTWVVRSNICKTQNRNGLSSFATTVPPVHPATH